MSPRSARETLDALDHAWALGDWQAVADLFDPADVNAFRDHELAVLTDRAAIYAEARRRGRRVSNWSSHAVLDLQRLAEFGSEPQPAFPGNLTLTDLASRSPKAFVVACLEAHAAAAEHVAARAKSLGMTTSPERVTTPKMVGEVAEAVDVVHILLRRPNFGTDDHPTRVHVRTLRRTGGEWYICLDHELRMRISPMFAFHAFEEPPEPDDGQTA
jgi:hypothetical protein